MHITFMIAFVFVFALTHCYSNIQAARLTYTGGLIVNCVAYWEKESDFWGDTKPRLNGSPSLKVRQSSPEPLSNALVVWYFCTMFTYFFAFMQCHRTRRAIFLLLLSKPSLVHMPPDPYQEGWRFHFKQIFAFSLLNFIIFCRDKSFVEYLHKIFLEDILPGEVTDRSQSPAPVSALASAPTKSALESASISI